MLCTPNLLRRVLLICVALWRVQSFVLHNPTTTSWPTYRSESFLSVSAILEYNDLTAEVETCNQSFVLKSSIEKSAGRRWKLFSKKRVREGQKQTVELHYDYEYYQMKLSQSTSKDHPMTGVMLIHPVGVGIGKWFYHRLYSSLSSLHNTTRNPNLVVVTPDLLGSASAVPTNTTVAPPLLNISDWTDQVWDLMATVQRDQPSIQQWCVVANGGCSPIALALTARSITEKEAKQKPVAHLILSSLPRLPFFLNATNPDKVRKSYKTLCGITGKIFWWYACRRQGKFIQKFSEKNLVASAENLGDDWTRNCVYEAKRNRGMSRYSTFAFLAGTLQDGCVQSFSAIEQSYHEERDRNGKPPRIGIIRGRDIRTNRARSWFWAKRHKQTPKTEEEAQRRATFSDFAQEKGWSVQSYTVGGRISLAHEDSVGYAKALLDLVSM